jgi:hypothetical protein
VPGGALLVPVGDLGAEGIRRVPERPRRRVGLVVPGAGARQRRRRGGGGPGVVVLGERAVRVGDEVLAQLDEVLLRRAEAAGADGAA